MTQAQPPQSAVNFLDYAKSPEGIRMIATAQRRIILCILAQLVLYVALIAGQKALPPAVLVVLFLGMLAVDILAMVFVFMLTTKMYGTGLGVLLGILTLAPCVGLITLLVVNGKATSILRQNGLKVGLLGAKVPDSM